MTTPRTRVANRTVAAGFSLRGKDAPVSRVRPFRAVRARSETRSSDAPVKGAATERNGAATEGAALLGTRPGFTLIEMLTVLVIMGIIMGIGIPAVTNLMKSSNLSAATRQVHNTLNFARQYAITQRVNTLVVFPFSTTPLTAAGANGTNRAPIYQSYAVVALGATTNYLSKWEILPVGAVFMSSDAGSSWGTPPPCLDNDLPRIYLPFPNTNIPVNSGTLSCVKFTPTGAASQASAFTITEGFVNGGTLTLTSKTSTGLVNTAVITVDNVVGRIRATRP